MVQDLKKEIGDEEVIVDGFPGYRVKCGNTNCIFEFVTYKYKGKAKKEEPKEQLQGETVLLDVPNNEMPPHPPSVHRSQSMPPNPYIIPYHYITPQSFDEQLMMSPPQQPNYAPEFGYLPPTQEYNHPHHHHRRPMFRRSHTMSGPHPELQESVFSPPGEHTPNNEDRSMFQVDNRRVHGGDGFEKEQSRVQDFGTRSRGFPRGMGGVTRGVYSRGGQGEAHSRSVRHRSSSSSGIMSPPFDPLTEEDPPSRSESFD